MKTDQPTTKKPKKKKKKKKKLRYHLSTMSTAIPLSPTTPTTDIAETTTPSKHWRLVAERLFRKPSQNLAKIHYAASSKQHDLSSPNHHDELEYLNDEIPSILDSARKYPLSRKFHFGKINTHEQGSPLTQHDSESLLPPSYQVDTLSAPSPQIFNYDIPGRTYHRYDRYGQYINDNENFEDYPSPEFLRQRGYYNKPWKYSNHDLTRPVDPFFADDRINWATRYRLWQTFRRPIFEVDDASQAEPGMYRNLGSWSTEKNMRLPSWTRSNDYNRDVGLEGKHKNRSELNEASTSSKQQVLPKISMKTWNSLTSDPATWPFKLTGAKPWPKDKNGKAYNPNADLVRKLGLDTQVRTLDKDNEASHQTKNTNNIVELSRKQSHVDTEDDTNDDVWNNDGKIWTPKISPKINSVGAWVMPSDQSTWKPSRWPSEQTMEATWQGKLTDWNVNGFGKQPSHSATWSPKWKQFSYHKINAAPIIKPGATLEGTPRTRNAFIAVSAVSPSKYSGNEWRKNDIEEISVDQSSNNVDKDDPTSQLLHNYQWQKKIQINSRDEKNETDSLEHQLAELGQNNLKVSILSTV